MTTKPKVYCASPYPRAKMWRAAEGSTILGPDVEIISTWHDSGHEEWTRTPVQYSAHWLQDFAEIRRADALLVYAELYDKPQGTIVEVGYALAQPIEVHIVGSYKWSTWQYHPLVTRHDTLREAVMAIVRSTNTNDPA